MSYVRTDVPQREWDQIVTEIASDLTQDVIDSTAIEANDPSQVVVRDLLPQEDFNSGGENGWTTDDAEWRQDWATDGTADAFNESYEIDSNGNAESKIVVFYGLSLPTNPTTRQLRFGVGTAATQGLKSWVELEPVENDDEGEAMLAEPVRYGATQDGSIEHWIDDASDGQRLRLLGLVGEATEATITQPSNPVN